MFNLLVLTLIIFTLIMGLLGLLTIVLLVSGRDIYVQEREDYYYVE